MSAGKSQPEAMMSEAFELLEAGEAEQALEIGRRLEARRYSGGFEIQALAHRDLDQNMEAIRVLKQGTELVPDLWMLWQLLGNCHSDNGAYEEALAAYDTALGLPHADRFSIQFNRANALWRAERPGEARTFLEGLLGDPEFGRQPSALQLHIQEALLGVLVDLDNSQEAVSRFEGFSIPADRSAYPAEAARLEAKYALALWRAGRSEEADRALRRVIRLDRTNDEARWLLREMRSTNGPTRAQCYTLLIEGPWNPAAFPEASEPSGFFTTYQVVAESLDEALGFIREFEPPEVRGALKIEEIKSQEPCDEPKGVYWTSAYAFFDVE